MRIRNSLFTIVLVVLTTVQLLNAQNKGTPFLTNYTPEEYKAGNQNWSIVQDTRGVLYFGNNKGILEFDGTSWRLIDPAYIIASKMHPSGTVYLGGRETFGILKPDSTGSMTYYSFANRIPDKYPLRYIRNIDFIGDTIWFSDENGTVIRKIGDSIEVTRPAEWLSEMHYLNDTMFQITRNGMAFYNKGNLIKIEGSEVLVGKRIMNLHWFNNRLIIVTRLNGLFERVGNTFRKWDIEINSFLGDNQVYASSQIKNEYLVFGTVQSGVMVINKQGTPVMHCNEKSGMINHDHCSIFIDNQNNIWSGLEYGLSNIHFNSPLTYFNEAHGLNNSAIYSIEIKDNNLYIGTARGIFYQAWDKTENVFTKDLSFKPIIGNVGRKVWDLKIINNQLLSANSNIGMFEINGPYANKVPVDLKIKEFLQIRNKNIVLCEGEHGGLYSIKKNKGEWELINYFDEIPFVSSYKEDSEGRIWTNLQDKGIKRITFNESYDKINEIKSFLLDTNTTNNTEIHNYKGQLLFSNYNGTYVYDKETDSFQKYKPFAALGKTKIEALMQDQDSVFWFMAVTENYKKIGLIKNGIPEVTIKNVPYLSAKEQFAFYPMDSSHILVGASDKLILVNPTPKYHRTKRPNIILRKVTLTRNTDSLLFNGAFIADNGIVTCNQSNEQSVIIPYINNSIQFEYSCIDFTNKNITYTHRLLGFDNEWSTPETANTKEYTNLPEGKYTFMVKALNFGNDITETTHYSFTIKAPWYRTGAAYAGYFLLFAILAFMIRRISIKKVEKENKQLEQVVNDRTKEIMTKNRQLELQKEEITAQRDEISIQQKKILDSIEYARHIQSALLPQGELFSSFFNDYFILYQPKDIVSGDFYWLKKIDDHILFTVADCTGHGIPGAFMSIMGISFLNEIVRRESVKTSNLVLDKLNEQVKLSLNQDTNKDELLNDIQKFLKSNVKDGIELAFCAINTKTNVMQFSGAENPLFIVRNNKIIEYEGTPIPIGIHYKNLPFELNEIRLEKGDRIYLLTDGFQDQFSSKTKMKYSIKKLKELLLKHHQKPMYEQKSILEDELAHWQGKADRVDDITVVGLRI